MEIIINEENFSQEVLEAQGPVLVDVWSSWCRPCMAMMPIMKILARKYTVCKMQMDENQGFCKQYNVSAIPAFLIFNNGELVEQRVGTQSVDELELIMKKLS